MRYLGLDRQSTINILLTDYGLIYTAQKMKFSIKYFFIICDQIRRKLIYQVPVLRARNNKLIHNSKDTATNIQSSGLKLVKLCYLVGSDDRKNKYFQMTCLLSTY